MLTAALGTFVVPSARTTVPCTEPEAVRCSSRCTTEPASTILPDAIAERPVTGSTAMTWNEPISTRSNSNVPATLALRVSGVSDPKVLVLQNVRLAFGTGWLLPSNTTPVTVPSPRYLMGASTSSPVGGTVALARPRLPSLPVASIVYDPAVTTGSSYLPSASVNVVMSGAWRLPAAKISTVTPAPTGVSFVFRTLPWIAPNTKTSRDLMVALTTLPSPSSSMLISTCPFGRFIMPVVAPRRLLIGSSALTLTCGPASPVTR